MGLPMNWVLSIDRYPEVGAYLFVVKYLSVEKGQS
jgi:hypothetical protein